jgi:hypothetical protein
MVLVLGKETGGKTKLSIMNCISVVRSRPGHILPLSIAQELDVLGVQLASLAQAFVNVEGTKTFVLNTSPKLELKARSNNVSRLFTGFPEINTPDVSRSVGVTNRLLNFGRGLEIGMKRCHLHWFPFSILNHRYLAIPEGCQVDVV